MISECPHCNQALRFSDAHKQKLAAALEKLAPGRTLKFGCPKCKSPIEITSDGFPAAGEKKPPAAPDIAQPPARPPVEPPKPQDIGWLSSGELNNDQILDNVPTAMVLMPEDDTKQKVVKSLEEHRYQLYFPETADEAVNSMRFRDFVVVVYHSEYEKAPLKNQDFHRFMMQMSMAKRRAVYYILIGPQFQTLFDLEALTFSANLVVNTREAEYLSTIMKKGRADYEALFNPYTAVLKKHGKN